MARDETLPVLGGGALRTRPEDATSKPVASPEFAKRGFITKTLIVGAVLAVMSSTALADVSVGQFADKRATLSDDKGSKGGDPNYIGSLYGGVGWKTGEASEDKPVVDVVRDHVVTALTSHGINKHRDEVRLCEHVLDQTLNDVVADPTFLAAIK